MSNEPVKSKAGYHRVEQAWCGDNKHKAWEAWFDENGQPMVMNNTYCRIEYEYDEKWNKTVERYYGSDGMLILCKDGYCRREMTYNSEGKVEAERHYGLDGNLIEE